MSSRLDGDIGLLIDRSRAIEFKFEGKTYQGYQGDSLTSALAACGEKLVSRSFKYHRPRGILTACGQDANTLVQLKNEPNIQADHLPITPGLSAKAQHYVGSLKKDRGALIEWISKFLPVGFYYKAFFRPVGSWEKIWAPMVRKRAGLGIVNRQATSDYYDKQYLFYDVVVVGGGPAGLEAALFVAQAGAKVALIDENARLGGALNYARFDADAATTGRELENLIAAVEAEDNITAMLDSVCNGWFSDNWLSVIQANRLYKIRSQAVILAVGMIEQPAIFHNNDLPGVMQGSAAQRLIRLYGVKPGENAVVLTANDAGYGVALDLADIGVTVKVVVDLRTASDANQGVLEQAAVTQGLRVLKEHAVYSARAGHDKNQLGGVEVRRIVRRGECDQSGETINCDLLCMSTGYTPMYQLACQAGATLSYADDTSIFSIDGLCEGVFIAGSLNGRQRLAAVRRDGQIGAWRALKTVGLDAGDKPRELPFKSSEQVNHPWPIFAHPNGKEFVDFDEDLTIADIRNAVADGYDHVQLTKRYSTVGMGPSQGRHSALTVARLVADATGKTVAETGLTTARPPFGPEKLGLLAGRSFYPERHTSMHHLHLESGAKMLLAGAWLRPAFYGDDRDACMQAEVVNVRNNVGLVDVSTLGGIEVRGPDAAEMIERMYTWNFKKQPIGRSRYVLLCNEAGVVIDDGVSCRIEKDYFYLTATTGGVDSVYRNMLRWNAQWRLDVDIANVTSTWCGVNIAGPNSRKVIERVCKDIDFSSEAFPYMGFRMGHVAGIQARVVRVGFVGELGYEVHVPQHYGEALWNALMAAGEPEEIKPFGIEAQRILRLEKGHIIIGQDTDAMSTPAEVHMSWALGKKKAFYMGQRTLAELDKQPMLRKLAGFIVDDESTPIPLESHLVMDGEQMTGRVTSCYFSPTLDKPIGLAYVRPEDAKPGNTVTIKVEGGARVDAKIVDLPFYDPDNQRQEM